MSKTIKFFLQLNDKEIKNIQELRDNFHANEIFRLHQAGILERWLRTCGYIKEAENIRNLPAQMEIRPLLVALAAILLEKPAEFDFDMWAYYIEFKKKTIEEYEYYDRIKFQRDEVIRNYHENYNALKTELLANSSDMYLVRERIYDITSKYMLLFTVDFENFLSKIKEHAPIVLLQLLSNEKIRTWITKNDKFTMVSRLANEALRNDKVKLFMLSPGSENTGDIKSLLRLCSKNTDTTWDNIEPDANKQLMIINMPHYAKVRDSLKNDVTGEVNQGLFPIVCGVEYNSQTNSTALIYMEV